jgi:hypothetical protein
VDILLYFDRVTKVFDLQLYVSVNGFAGRIYITEIVDDPSKVSEYLVILLTLSSKALNKFCYFELSV